LPTSNLFGALHDGSASARDAECSRFSLATGLAVMLLRAELGA